MIFISLIFIIILLALFFSFKCFLYFSGNNVTNKENALDKIAYYMKTYDIDNEDIQYAFNNHKENIRKDASDKGHKLKTLLIYLGGIFILSGLSIYISSFWGDMGSFIRVSITLGFGLMLYITTLIFIRDDKYKKSLNILSLISLPFTIAGWHVFFEEYAFINDMTLTSAFIYIFVAFQYGYLYLKDRNNLFLIIGIFFFYLFLNVALILSGLSLTAASLIFGGSLIMVGMKKINGFTPLKTILMMIGIFYFYSGILNLLISLNFSNDFAALTTSILLIGTKLITKEEKYLVPVIELIGTLMFYVSLFNILTGNLIEPIYLLISGAILYYSLLIKNNVILATSSISFMSFIIYYSNEYFLDSIGWSLSLVFLGIIFLGLGTIVINVRKKQK